MMVVHPEVQEKAQAEIDTVVGKDRLPTMDDRPSLPYLDAIFREIFRYSPIVPLSLPHSAVDDDVYEGFYIPKGEYQAITLSSRPSIDTCLQVLSS
jgi:cytochrome P450